MVATAGAAWEGPFLSETSAATTVQRYFKRSYDSLESVFQFIEDSLQLFPATAAQFSISAPCRGAVSHGAPAPLQAASAQSCTRTRPSG